MDETMRVNGTASVTTDSELLATMELNGHVPHVALLVHIEEAFIHCGKSLKRRRVWDPDARIDRSLYPKMGEVMFDHGQLAERDITREQMTEIAQTDYDDNVYWRRSRRWSDSCHLNWPTMTLADENYIAFTTFKKDGTRKPTPVWPVDAGEGRIAFITAAESWKVKRLANDVRVELQPSDARGRVKEGTSHRSGTAEVVAGSEFDNIRAKVREKYGYKVTLVNGIHSVQRLIRRGGQPSDRAIIVTLNDD